jgi:HEAT repeat protein
LKPQWAAGNDLNQPAAPDSEVKPAPGAVKVINRKNVGDYQVTVLSASVPGSLQKWLAANQFVLPKDLAGVLDDYVTRHWYFVAIKINPDKSARGHSTTAAHPSAGAKPGKAKPLIAGELQPLHLGFASDQCVFPLKISSVNGTPSQVRLYVFSAEPLVERTLFEQQIPAVRQLAEAGLPTPPSADENNIARELACEAAVPAGALLPCAAVAGKEFPACARLFPGFKGKKWWLTTQSRTFQPAEMRDLWFQPAIPALVEDLAGETGFYAARNLDLLGSNAVPALLPALQQTNLLARVYGVQVLRDLATGGTGPAGQKVLDYLPALLQDPEACVRATAAQVAGANWRPSLTEPLLKLLRDDDAGAARGAIEGLTNALHRNPARAAEIRSAVQPLLQDPNPRVQSVALEVLGSVRAPAPRSTVVSLLAESDPAVVARALKQLEQDGFAYEELLPLRHHPAAAVRLTWLQVMDRFQYRSAIPDLIPLLRDPDPQVQTRAWELLQAFTGSRFPQDQPDLWTKWWGGNKYYVLVSEASKVIGLHPDNGELYHIRGCLNCDLHQFPRARADFRKAVQFGSHNPDYPRFRLWLIRARLGDRAAATRELKTYLAARRGRPGDWSAIVGRFLAGDLSEAGLLQAAASPEEPTDRAQHCEAWFYAGMKRLIARDNTTAAEDFRKCLATRMDTFNEYASAIA